MVRRLPRNDRNHRQTESWIMPKKTHREKLQVHTRNPAQLLAFYFGKRLHKHLLKQDSETPLKWCCMAALFSINGQYAQTHSAYPNWLRDSFLKRHKVTIYSLEWCRKESEKFLRATDYRSEGKPKYENHALLATIYLREYEKTGQPITPKLTASIVDYAEANGWTLDDGSAGEQEDRNKRDDVFTKAEKKLHETWAQFCDFRKSPEGQFWGEV